MGEKIKNKNNMEINNQNEKSEEELKKIEDEIIEKIERIIKEREVPVPDLNKIIEIEIKSMNYLKEDWQVQYAVERIKNEIREKNIENTSGQRKEAMIPSEIKAWNWGAFFLTWLWGMYNKTYIALLCFIPFVGIVMPFILGAKGNEWAWRNKRWESIEHFQRVQKKWAWWGLGVSLFGIIMYLIELVIL